MSRSPDSADSAADVDAVVQTLEAERSGDDPPMLWLDDEFPDDVNNDVIMAALRRIVDENLVQMTGSADRPEEQGILDVLCDRPPPAPDAQYADPSTAPLAFDQLQTGDILFCAGTARSSIRLRQAQGSAWSHAALVVKEEAGVDNYRWWCVQASAHDVEHPHEQRRPGVYRMPLQDFLWAYVRHAKWAEQVAVRRLVTASEAQRAAVARLALSLTEQNVPYHATTLEFYKQAMLGSVDTLPFVRYISNNKNAFFCSELVAAILIRAKVLDGARSPRHFSPEALARLADAQLVGGALFGGMERVAIPAAPLSATLADSSADED